MTRVQIACAISALALSLLARAEGARPDPKALAMADGRLSYCAKAVPSSAATYQARVQQLTKGASKQVLADVRKSEDYRRARESVDDFVGKVDQHNARNVCHETLAQRK